MFKTSYHDLSFFGEVSKLVFFAVNIFIALNFIVLPSFHEGEIYQ